MLNLYIKRFIMDKSFQMMKFFEIDFGVKDIDINYG